MCGRYGLFTPPSTLETRFDASVRADFEPTYNAAPGASLPIVADEASTVIHTAEWGLIPSWADNPDDHRYINARVETLAERASFREPAQRQRCLVPADGFFEWGSTDGERRPHFIRRSDGEPFAMAGLWERWTPSTTQTELGAFDAGGETTADPIETFTIITTEANPAVEPIHERMPVVLPPDEEHAWLSAERPATAEAFEPVAAETLRVDPVSRAVNDPTNDRPDLVTPIDR